ncbi:hypothetical protein GT370_00835 [Acidocella sp. MX-AZ03]|uniref:hypothetical protein n=1 Tax=Acidocella sp. MX-AZ03 TaxID=2697363 RepID=UPI0022DD495B|nr:hypothetical protein [Acidocella sp. MX-AZ03]WBO59527.1 hypothetical protein GT370_00835 [Acidocella sp. MX-AZ03]
MPQVWLFGLLGGLMIGGAAALMLLGLGRIAGVSGLSARAVGLADAGASAGWPGPSFSACRWGRWR